VVVGVVMIGVVGVYDDDSCVVEVTSVEPSSGC